MTKTIVTLAATVCGICALAALPASAADVRGELTRGRSSCAKNTAE